MSEALAVLVPQMNPNDEHVVIVRWHVESGSQVAADQPLATVETTKAAFDISAPQAGYAFFDAEANSVVAVGDVVAWISESPQPPQKPAPAPVKQETRPDAPSGEARISRKALRLMAERGLTPADFPEGSRVEVSDVERVAREREARAQAPADAERLPQSPAKVLEVARLGAVYAEAIPSTVTVALPCEALNRRLQQLADQSGPVSVLELAIHDVARVLASYPELNGYYAGAQAWTYRTVAVGFAINLGRSLRVPVVRRAAEIGCIDIARAVRELSLKYMRNELTVDDVTGGTFTVTDLSAFGVVQFVPVLNERQSAILGICAERPGSGHRDLVLTFDHRMADGMRAAAFLTDLVAALTASA
jgi:2-oxoglutarate dehydrogenase E2 component (dihydrolipoamide succinyltransferase)